MTENEIYRWLADEIEDIIDRQAIDDKRKYWLIQMAYEKAKAELRKAKEAGNEQN